MDRAVREVRAHIAEIRARQGNSEAAEGEVIVVTREVGSAAASSSASLNNPGAAVGRTESGDHQRDARLGRWRHIGDFLTQCDRDLGISRPDVMEIAGLNRRNRDALLLLEFEGGLAALYAKCESKVKEPVRG